jgi:hypothetical protein
MHFYTHLLSGIIEVAISIFLKIPNYTYMKTIRSVCKKNLISVISISSVVAVAVLLGCKPKEKSASASSSRYLYVASGACYSGSGNTTFTNTTSSNLVYRIDTATGVRDEILADYNGNLAQIGDTPVGLVQADSNNLYVLVENTTTASARRIEKVAKSGGARSLFSNNTTALSAQLRGFAAFANGDLLISKSTAAEYITSANIRLLKGANPYVSAPAAPCATSTTLIPKVLMMNNQFIMFLHSAASQNRFGFVKPQGYAAAGDCTVAQSAPNVNSYPVAAAYDTVNNKLIVAYSGNAITTDINSIYVYNITETASSITIGAANKIYDTSGYPSTYPYLLYGISEMVLDTATNQLYVATATTMATTVSNYAIEKFSYDPTKIGTDNTNVLTRSPVHPFYQYGVDTKCISSMIVTN